jgi:abhydrolase domain-containing protein 6
MKSDPFGIFRLSLIIIVLLSMASCSGFKNGAYDMAMGMERSRSGLEEILLIVDDLEIAVLEGQGRGERPTIVLVHGFGASKEVWLRFSRQLKDEFHIIAVDLPGHGRSSMQMNLDYRISSQVAYLRSIIDALALDKPHLAGNSMGGAITALYAARYPEETASLILFNPGGISIHESEMMAQFARGENPLLVETPEDFETLLNFSMEKKPFLIWPITSVMAQRAIARRPLNEKIFNDIVQDADRDFQGVLSAIRIPVLIVWGRHDRLINVENGRVFDELIPDSRLVILEDAGHVPMIETPGVSAALVREFIMSVDD